jgi:hypothetical protein
VIDEDNVTGITVSVKEIGQDPNGRNTVVLQAANQAYSADMTYDKDTGMIMELSDSKLGVDSNEYTDLKLAQTS